MPAPRSRKLHIIETPQWPSARPESPPRGTQCGSRDTAGRKRSRNVLIRLIRVNCNTQVPPTTMNCTIYTKAMLQKSQHKSRLRVPRSLLEGRPRSRDCIGGAGAFGIPSIVVARITGRRLGFLKVTRLSIPHDGSGRASRGPERGSAPDALGPWKNRVCIRFWAPSDGRKARAGPQQPWRLNSRRWPP